MLGLKPKKRFFGNLETERSAACGCFAACLQKNERERKKEASLL